MGEAVRRLRYVKRGDIIYESDHNDKIDALLEILHLIEEINEILKRVRGYA